MEQSTEKPVSPPKGVPEKHVSPPPKTEVPPPEVAPPPPPPRGTDCFVMDVALRITLFVAALVSVVVMVTSKQTELVPYPLKPSILVPAEAKFNYSPALIYFVAAFSVVCLYSLITTLASLSVILKPVHSTFFTVHLALMDVLMLGLAASATGTAGGVAYIGLRGNSHVNWAKICPVYDKFCRHLGGSIGVSLFAAFLLVFLIMLAIRSLGSKIQLARRA